MGNLNSIVPNSDVVIQGLRSLAINGIRSCGDNFTVAEPCVELTTLNTLAHVSGEGDIAAFANGIITISKVSSNTVNNRNIISSDHDAGHVETSLSGKRTVFEEVGNLNKVCCSGINHISLSRLSHTRNSIVRVSTFDIPLINEVWIIVVVEVCSKLSLTTLTDSGLCSSNVNIRFVVHINLKRFTDGDTTIGVGYFNSERVRVVVSWNPVLSIVVVIDTTTNVVTELVVLVPCVGHIRIIVTINPSNQVDIVSMGFSVRAIVAYIVVTGNRNDRVTFDEYYVRRNQLGFTTFNTEIDIGGVLIREGVIIFNIHLFVECRASDARHQEAVLIPYISE